jgi:hypothetical protein
MINISKINQLSKGQPEGRWVVFVRVREIISLAHNASYTRYTDKISCPRKFGFFIKGELEGEEVKCRYE